MIYVVVFLAELLVIPRPPPHVNELWFLDYRPIDTEAAVRGDFTVVADKKA